MCVRDLPRSVRRRRAQGFGFLLLSQLTASGMLAPLLDGWRIVIAVVLLAAGAALLAPAFRYDRTRR